MKADIETGQSCYICGVEIRQGQERYHINKEVSHKYCEEEQNIKIRIIELLEQAKEEAAKLKAWGYCSMDATAKVFELAYTPLKIEKELVRAVQERRKQEKHKAERVRVLIQQHEDEIERDEL